jgi:pyruvate dehydrogenase E1 component alpha subunit
MGKHLGDKGHAAMTIKKEKAAAAAGAQPGKNGFALISGDKLLQLYAAMLKCRMLQERVFALSNKNKLKGIGSSTAGQEAAVAGTVIDLFAEDFVGGSDSGFIASFVKGTPLDEIFRQLNASKGRANTLATQLALAIGAARDNKTNRNGRIAVVFRGDASASPALWQKTLSRAGAQGLPMLFVSHSGLESAPSRLQVKTDNIASKAEDYGFPQITVDGNDVVAVYRVASEAIAHARKGSGPTLIECVPYRLSGPGENDPIPNMEKYLLRKGLFTGEFKAQVAAAFSRELDAAMKAAETGTRSAFSKH